MQSRIPGHQTRQPVRSGRNIRLLLAFDGSAFHGWQFQPGKPTIQGTIQDSIEKITGERARLTGSGRTDAGTHARGLVANFITTSTLPARSWGPALNRLLPREIRVLSARRVPLRFHARLQARSKVYRYQIYQGSVLPPHLAHENFHYPYPTDLLLMQKASRLFVGEHDFASFAAKSGVKTGVKEAKRGAEGADYEVNTIRNILRCDLRKCGKQLIVTVEGNGFLHHMVRNMVGTLLELGRGKIPIAKFKELLRRRDRTLAGFTAPAHGLILLRVRY